jgi:hypothetical protein
MEKRANQLWEDMEEKVRREPAKSVLLATAAGVLIAFLPLGWLIRVLVKSLFFVTKPSLILLGVVKLLEVSGFE